MFTGFATENTPAIKVWNYWVSVASSIAPQIICLSDDCPPIHVFNTGYGNTALQIYLPSCPIEGKTITIINQRFSSNTQNIRIYSSDSSNGGDSLLLYSLGQGASITLFYSKEVISGGNIVGGYASGWIVLNGMPACANNSYAISIGGTSNSAVSPNSAVIGGNNNNSSGSNAITVGGSSNTSSGSSAVVIGGSSNVANSTSAIVVGGSSNSSSATNAVCAAGSNSSANGNSSFVASGSFGTSRSITGSVAFAASLNPITSASGVSQTETLILARQTTDATVTTLCSNTSAASTSNQVIQPNNSAYYFRGTVIANVTGGGDTKAWTFDGAIKRGANAASTALVGTPTVTSNYANAGAAAWTIALAADTTNGGLQVTVTGAAATTIRWVCRIETTEVTF